MAISFRPRSPRSFTALLVSFLAVGVLASASPLRAASASFVYDARGRLIQVVYSDGGQVTYTYDAAGNRTEHDTRTNALPLAVADSYSTPVNTALSVNPRTNDSDPDPGAVLSVAAVSAPAHGTAVITGGGSGVTYTPATGWSGTDSFVYTLSDEKKGLAKAVITVAVGGGANNSPVAVADSRSTGMNTLLTFDPRANDTDADGDALTITSKTNGAHGAVAILSGGTLVSYMPATGWSGTDSFTYTIADGRGGTAIGTATVTVSAANGAPTPLNDSVSTTLNTAVTFDPRGNDSDPDGDALTISAKTDGAHGTVAITAGASLTYTPATGYAGPDNVTYTVSDGRGGAGTAAVSITVTAGANVAPVAEDDAVDAFASNGGGPGVIPEVTFDPRENDTDADGDTLTITGKTNGAKGTVAFTGTSLTYTYYTSVNHPMTDTDTFTYTLSDGHGHTDTATVSVAIAVDILE